MRVLFYGESPYIETGCAQVAKRHIETFIELGWEVDAVCINHTIQDDRYCINIHNTNTGDVYATQDMKREILNREYDLIFMSTDCQNVSRFNEEIQYVRGQKKFKTICYCPLDCDIINPEVFSGMVLSDVAVTATKHACSVLSRIIPAKQIRIIAHGCEPDLFRKISYEERKEIRKSLFNADDNTFIVLFAGRNQQRKDFARGMYAFHLFHLDHPNSLCYMHSRQNDVGGSLPFYAKLFGMIFGTKEDEIYFAEPSFDESQGIPRDRMNIIYNLADLYASSSTGEGWGLCTTEAMAAGTPVLVPHNTSHIEIVGNDQERGYFIKCGGIDLWTIPYNFTHNPRDIVSTSDMVKMMDHIYHNREEAQRKALLARQWTENYTWKDFKEEWKTLLVTTMGTIE